MSLVFQRLDNRGTVIDVDPWLRGLFPDESDDVLLRRVKMESAYVKLYGRRLELSRSLAAWVFGEAAPKAMVMIDGDAFITEFVINSRDVSGRRSSMLFFGYMPRDASPQTFQHARSRLMTLVRRNGLDARSYESAWTPLEASLHRVSRERLGSPRRPIFVPELEPSSGRFEPPDAVTIEERKATTADDLGGVTQDPATQVGSEATAVSRESGRDDPSRRDEDAPAGQDDLAGGAAPEHRSDGGGRSEPPAASRCVDSDVDVGGEVDVDEQGQRPDQARSDETALPRSPKSPPWSHREGV
ncbi:hypothetical protein [Geodermatophilus sp. URMC 64]